MTKRPDALDALRRYAHHLRAEAPTRPAVMPDPVGATGRSSLRVLALAATLCALAFASLAAVADDSVPGDLLHPFDRAGEWVVDLTPWGADRATERLAEVEVLIDRGHVGRALVAVERVAERAAADRADVQELLAMIEAMQAVPEPDTASDSNRGEEVRLIARTLGSLVAKPAQTGQPETPGQGSQPQTPGQGSQPQTPGQGSGGGRP
ncbi:MAG: hypothetical protein R6X29_09425 [Acidimicrobiia bacterium]